MNCSVRAHSKRVRMTKGDLDGKKILDKLNNSLSSSLNYAFPHLVYLSLQKPNLVTFIDGLQSVPRHSHGHSRGFHTLKQLP